MNELGLMPRRIGAHILSVDPRRCRLSTLREQDAGRLTLQGCAAQLRSIERYGQFVPALARPVVDDPNHHLEILCGGRRWFIASHLQRPLRVQVIALADREALIAMDAENRNRRDISPYERGMSYARWLRQQHFASQEEIAGTLQVSTAQVSRLLKMAKLPPVLVGTFGTPADICEAWGVQLAEMWENPTTRPALLNNARATAAAASEGHLSPRRIYDLLTGGERKNAAKRRSAAASPPFQVRSLKRAVVVTLPVALSPPVLSRITQQLKTILQGEE